MGLFGDAEGAPQFNDIVQIQMLAPWRELYCFEARSLEMHGNAGHTIVEISMSHPAATTYRAAPNLPGLSTVPAIQSWHGQS
jgi:hypothetical protein